MASRVLIFNKPFNVLSQFTPGSSAPANRGARLNLADFIDVPDVYPVGRLDFDSEGLMLLTDDGALQHRLSNPRFAHPRTYWVQVEGTISDPSLNQLSAGVTIGDYRTRAAVAKGIEEPVVAPRNPPIRVRQRIPTSWLELTLTEGRNRQVRRMTAAVGFPTLRLIRVKIGALALESLPPGKWRPLTPAELLSLNGDRNS